MKPAHLMLLGTLALGASSLVACKSGDEQEKPATTTKTPDKADGTQKTARAERPPIDEGIDVPTEEDFEEAVATQITESSDLKKELDALEKEIGQ